MESLFKPLARQAALVHRHRTDNINVIGSVEREINNLLPDIMQAMNDLGWEIRSPVVETKFVCQNTMSARVVGE